MRDDGERPFRPYAPAATVDAVLQRLRRMNVPPRISPEFLRGAGVSDALAPRVIAALRFLSLVNDNDEPTDTLRGLAMASDEDFRTTLEGVIRTAYADDLRNVDPATDPQSRIINAFQRYTPSSQHARQVMLFLGLARAAGVTVLDAPRNRRVQATVTARRAQPNARNTGRAAVSGVPQPPAKEVASPSLLFGITLEDIGVLGEEDFEEVWTALGKVARARAQAKAAQKLNGSDDRDGRSKEDLEERS